MAGDWPTLAAGALDDVYGLFAEAMTYTPPGGVATEVNGVFSREPIAVEEIGDTPILSSRLTAHLRVSELGGSPPVSKGTLVIRGTTYEIASVEKPDEDGEVVAVLHRP